MDELEEKTEVDGKVYTYEEVDKIMNTGFDGESEGMPDSLVMWYIKEKRKRADIKELKGRTYIGIDPGSSGFVSVIYPDNELDFFSIADNHISQMVKFMEEVKEKSGGNLVCCMEEVHAIYGSSASSTFVFGNTCGIIEGILMATRVPYSKVQPKEWQGLVWINQDVEYKIMRSVKKDKKSGVEKVRSQRRVDTKKTSINAAIRLFPEVDFRRNAKSKKNDDNKCDATLICEYARRMNL